MELLTYTLLSFGSLFSIVDPFAALPIFLALVGQQPKALQKRTAFRASLTCFVVLFTFGLGGSLIFRFFGITIPAFKIAGGILLFGVGLEMMRAQQSKTRGTEEEAQEAESKEDVGLIPLGIPLLSGPGAIATTMVYVGQAKDMPHKFAVLFATFLVAIASLVILRSASTMSRWLGQTGINVISRIMGLILAAVAVQFIVDGSKEAFPFLVGRM
jgi:multiple antibiotic resistance protein